MTFEIGSRLPEKMMFFVGIGLFEDVLHTGYEKIPIISEKSERATDKEMVSEPEANTEVNLPDWIRDLFIWYGEGKIGDKEIVKALEFLIKQGIIKI